MNFSVLSSSMAGVASEAGRALGASMVTTSVSGGDSGPVSGGKSLESPAVQVNISAAVLKKAQEMQKQEIANLIH